jgi:hypothetical protein
MLSYRIQFKNSDATFFLGRNGFFQCRGLDISSCFVAGGVVSISPITSKGKVGRAMIDFPVNCIPALVELLQSIYAKEKTHARNRDNSGPEQGAE